MKNKAISRLTAVTLVIGAVNFFVSLIYIIGLPDIVPMHTDFSWKCNGIGSKWNGLIIPLVIFALIPLCLLITRNAKNAEKNLKPLAVCVSIIELFLVAVNWLMLGLVMGSSAEIGEKISSDFAWLFPLMFGFLFMVLGNYMPTVRQNPHLGLRVPWTLKNEKCWDLTHRFMGRICVIAGLAVIAAVLLLRLTGLGNDVLYFVLMMALIFFCAIIPTIYAYKHRND